MPTVRGLDFETHFREQYPRLVSELDFILGDTALACDVAQDAFIRQYISWARLSHFDKPGAWVRKVALRLAFKVRRKLSRNVELDENHDSPTSERHVPTWP